MRTIGLVLFLQVLTLPSVLHCLPPAGHVEPVFSDSMFSAAVRRNNRELHNTEKKVLFATCAAPVPRYTRHDLLSLETAATPPPFFSPQLIARLLHLGIARNVPRKPRRSRRGGKNERRKIKVIVGFRERLPSDSSSSPTPCQHTTSVPPSSPPSDRDDLSASSLSAPLRPPHRQLLHIPLSSSSAENTLLVCLFKARSVGTSRKRSDNSTFIQDNNIDIMLLTETWLRPAKIADPYKNLKRFRTDASKRLTPAPLNKISLTLSHKSVQPISDYNNHLCSVLDKHASLCLCTVRTRKPTSWFSSIAELFCELKRERRQAERRWLKSKLTVHKQIYDSIKQKVTNLVDKSKQACYSAKIQCSTTCKQLF